MSEEATAASGPTLADRFRAAPHLFDIDVARLIRDDLAALDPDDETARDISHPTNRFQPTEFVKDASRAGDDRPAANYLGLIGPVAALPTPYNDATIAERKRRSSSLFDFLEMFAAQLRDMFVDAHRKYRLPSLFQLYRTGEENRITGSVFALIGFGTERMRERLTVHREIPLYYSGYFASQRRTAVSLQLMLQDFLGLPVTVEQFRLRRLPIAEDEQTRMGLGFDANAALGLSAVAGSSALDRTSAIRVRIGPLDYGRYLSLLPSRELYPQLVELIRLYCGPSLSFDIQLVLKAAEIPQTKIDTNSPVGRLGWDTWALSSPAGADSEDTIFDPELLSA